MAIFLTLSFGSISIPVQQTMNAREMRKQQKEGHTDVRAATSWNLNAI